MKKLWLRLLVVIAAVLINGGAVSAQQSYPYKPIRLISPFAPGGSTDVLGRLFGAKLYGVWNQPVVVENKPGAGGNIGTELVAKAQPDGYTLLIVPSSLAINPSLYPKAPFDVTRDLAAVALIGKATNVLLVSPSLPVNSVKELIDYAKQKDGSLNYGSGGSGTAPHIIAELFKHQAGVKMQHIAYQGSGPALLALLKGEVTISFSNMVAAIPHVKGGKVKLLAITSSERNRAVPDTPTIAEAAIPGFDADNWYGFLATAGTPSDVIEKLNKQINVAMKDEKVNSTLLSLGITPAASTAVQFSEFIKAEIVKWRKAVEIAGAKVD